MKACPLCNGPGANQSKVGEYWLLKCRNCRFVYADATDEQIEQVNFQYGEFAEHHYAEVQGGIDYLWFDRISAQLTRGRSGLKVLDIGCGNGVLLRQFQKRGSVCTGSDPSPWAPTCAEQYGYALLPRIEEADIEPGSFDIITSTSALEHVGRPREHVQRIFELLKPGGTAYFTVPNYGSLPIRLHLVKGRLVNPPGHCNYFTAGTLKGLFRQKSLNEQVAKVRVRSYGIPEIHGLYQRVTKRAGSVPVRASKEVSSVKCEVSSGDPALHTSNFRRDTSKATPHGVTTSRGGTSGQPWLKKALVSIYYWSGTPFGLGDKLEALVEKRTGRAN